MEKIGVKMNIKTQAQLNIYKICSAATKKIRLQGERLMTATGMPDRMVRKIERMRKNGTASAPRTVRPDTALSIGAEYKDFRRSYASRLYEGLKTLSAMDGQPKVKLSCS